MTNEPERLVRGKAFHSRVQEEWLAATFGSALSEQPTADDQHRLRFPAGRMDVRMIDPDEPMAFVVELKDSDFEAMTMSEYAGMWLETVFKSASTARLC